MSKVTIDGKEFELNLQKAREMGLLKEILHYPLKAGDVYIHPKGTVNSLLLVEILYTNDNNIKAYQLLGICGVKVNSNKEYQGLFTKDEVRTFLTERDMVFAENIQCEINSLMYKAEKAVITP